MDSESDSEYVYSDSETDEEEYEYVNQVELEEDLKDLLDNTYVEPSTQGFEVLQSEEYKLLIANIRKPKLTIDDLKK